MALDFQMDGRQGEELKWRVDRQVDRWAERPNQAAPLLTSCGLGSPTLAWNDLFFCSILGPTLGVRLCFQRIPSCCCQLGKGGERSECVVSGQSCLSEAFHPCLTTTAYQKVRPDREQTRGRVEQRRFGSCIFWKTSDPSEFLYLWLQTAECEESHVTLIWIYHCSSLSMFFWTYFLCNRNTYLCSTIKTKQKPPFLFWGWH